MKLLYIFGEKYNETLLPEWHRMHLHVFNNLFKSSAHVRRFDFWFNRTIFKVVVDDGKYLFSSIFWKLLKWYYGIHIVVRHLWTAVTAHLFVYEGYIETWCLQGKVNTRRERYLKVRGKVLAAAQSASSRALAGVSAANISPELAQVSESSFPHVAKRDEMWRRTVRYYLTEVSIRVKKKVSESTQGRRYCTCMPLKSRTQFLVSIIAAHEHDRDTDPSKIVNN